MNLTDEIEKEFEEKFRDDGTTSKVQMKLHFKAFLRQSIERAYDEGYAARGGVESEQKQRMYDAGVSVGRTQALEEANDCCCKEKWKFGVVHRKDKPCYWPPQLTQQ